MDLTNRASSRILIIILAHLCFGLVMLSDSFYGVGTAFIAHTVFFLLIFSLQHRRTVFYPPTLLLGLFYAFGIITLFIIYYYQDSEIPFLTKLLLFREHFYAVLTQEFFLLTYPLLLIYAFLPNRAVTDSTSADYYPITRTIWWVFYVIGVAAIVYLVIRGGGLDFVSASRRSRVAGAGLFVNLQYLTLVGIGLFILFTQKKGVFFHLVSVAALATPLLLTGERSFLIVIVIAVVAYHAIYTRKISVLHLLVVAPLSFLGLVFLLKLRSEAFTNHNYIPNTELIVLISKDVSMNTGYLVARALEVFNYEASLETLLLPFSFVSSFLKFFLGEIPVSPNNYFTSIVFPNVNGTSTYSMGAYGESNYLFGDHRLVYGFLVFGAFQLLTSLANRGDPILMILLAGFAVRIAKGGIAGGFGAVLIACVLILFLKISERTLALFLSRVKINRG